MNGLIRMSRMTGDKPQKSQATQATVVGVLKRRKNLRIPPRDLNGCLHPWRSIMSTAEALEDGRVAHASDPQNPQALEGHLAGAHPSEESLFSAQEQELLEGYDRLEQLTIELALLSAQEKLSQGGIINELGD